MNGTILIAEDDPELGLLYRTELELEGFSVDLVTDGEEAIARARSNPYALLILDVKLPGKSGVDVCRIVRGFNTRVPILMVTTKSEEIDRVVGLEIGADDYIAKPFSMRELLARIRAKLRMVESLSAPSHRQRPEGVVEVTTELPPARVLKYGDLEINYDTRTAQVRGEPAPLTQKEFDLLLYLAERPGRPLSHEQILESVWELNTAVYEESVGAMVLRIRKKIEDNPSDPRYILTVRGFGYRFASREEVAPPEPDEDES